MSENITSTPVSGGDVSSNPVENTSPQPQTPSQPSKPKINWNDLSDEDRNEILSSYREKMVINGKEKEMTLAEMKKKASIQEAANEKFEFGKKAVTELDQFKKDLDSGKLVDALKRQGKSTEQIKEILMDRLADLMEEEKLDPKEKELRELKAKIAQQEEAEKNAKEREEQDRVAKEEAQYREKLEQDMIKHIKQAGLPDKNPLVYKAVVQELIAADSAGVELSVKEAVDNVYQDMVEQYTSILPNLGVEKLRKVLGKDLLKQLQADVIAETKQAASPFAKQPQPMQKTDSVIKPVEIKEEKEAVGNPFSRLRRKAAE